MFVPKRLVVAEMTFNDNLIFPEGSIGSQYFIELVPIVWLPLGISQKLLRAFRDDDINPISESFDEKQEQTLDDTFYHVIYNWNLTNRDGTAIALPTKESPKSWRTVPFVVLMGIIESMMDMGLSGDGDKDEDEIPLASKSKLAPLSSVPAPSTDGAEEAVPV